MFAPTDPVHVFLFVIPCFMLLRFFWMVFCGICVTAAGAAGAGIRTGRVLIFFIVTGSAVRYIKILIGPGMP